MALEDEGYHVDTACNGAVALDRVAHSRPDAIVLDLRMPIMDGPAFLQAYHQRTANVPPVVICSTRFVDAASIGFDVAACLIKPVDIETVIAVLDRVTANEVALPQRTPAHIRASAGRMISVSAAAPLT